MYEPLLFVARGTELAPENQTENIKLIFHSAPTPVRQIYVDIPSINGWKIDGIGCPWVEHEAAGGIVDTSAIFGRSLVLSFNLVGQPTDALLHASVWSEKMESRRACHRNVPSLSVCVKSLLTSSGIVSPANTISIYPNWICQIHMWKETRVTDVKSVCKCSFSFKQKFPTATLMTLKITTFNYDKRRTFHSLNFSSS